MRQFVLYRKFTLENNLNAYLATLLTLVITVSFLRLMDVIANRGWMDGKLSRKLIHIGTGPIFVLCWLMFSDATISRWLAALIPLLVTIQFALVGLGIIRDEASVQAMSRTGDRHEILRGPLLYGIMFVLLTIVYWKDSPIGIAALMMMCGGDGIADIIGRRIKSPKLAWSREKSFAGLVSVFVGGLLMTLFVVAVYIGMGVFAAPLAAYLLPITLIALGGTLVESLPFRDIDNITVTVVSAIIGHLVF